MALFQKKPQVQTSAPLYTVSANKTLLIIGLGNPDEKYDGTRHNAGFSAIDFFAAKNEFPGWVVKKDLKCAVAINRLGENQVVLCKPMTFMNLSGEAAHAVQRYYRVANHQSLVIYDELAIPFGQLRTRIGGSDAGHNGVKSLIQHLGEDFGRLRIGIGSEAAKKSDAADFVLKKFNKPEQAHLPQIWRETNAIITEFVFGDALRQDTRNAW